MFFRPAKHGFRVRQATSIRIPPTNFADPRHPQRFPVSEGSETFDFTTIVPKTSFQCRIRSVAMFPNDGSTHPDPPSGLRNDLIKSRAEGPSRPRIADTGQDSAAGEKFNEVRAGEVRRWFSWP